MSKSIPEGTVVSFIDPVSQLPVKGVVKLELSEFIGVDYSGKYLAPAPGKGPRMLKTDDGKMIAWINISKERVFVVKG